MFHFKNKEIKDLFQWSRDIVLEFDQIYAGEEAHFSNNKINSLNKKINENGEVTIPNILLTESTPIEVYLFIKEGPEQYTKKKKILPVIARPKPEDYIYTEEENKIWDNKVDIFQGKENSKKILSTNENGEVITEISVDEILTNKDISRPTSADNGKYLGCKDGAAMWMPVDASGGGGGDKWELIHHGTVGSVGVSSYLVDRDIDGNAFSLSKFELTYSAHNPTGYLWIASGGPVFNGLHKSKFSTNGNASGNDSYLGCVGKDSNIDKTKGVHTIAKYYGSVVDGYLMIRGFMSGYGYNADGKVVSLSGVAGNFTVGKWNDIISKGQIFEEGVKSIELKFDYDSLANATVTIRGVRA